MIPHMDTEMFRHIWCCRKYNIKRYFANTVGLRNSELENGINIRWNLVYKSAIPSYINTKEKFVNLPKT